MDWILCSTIKYRSFLYCLKVKLNRICSAYLYKKCSKFFPTSSYTLCPWFEEHWSKNTMKMMNGDYMCNYELLFSLVFCHVLVMDITIWIDIFSCQIMKELVNNTKSYKKITCFNLPEQKLKNMTKIFHQNSLSLPCVWF
jgi:hypothetical protein